ncbi:hypothetical protein [Euzebya tangerina]|uniref:hypothetical protein n=1 Tax=Euzebya tangerina TaxID=591198 RepID=UPI0013C36F72|nr:hypothetical protein [Euzebya tangerina]
MSVATFAQEPDPEGILTVTVEGASGPRETAVSGADLTDGAWVAASFDPPVVVGDLAEVQLSWDGATPLAVWSNRTLAGTVGIENDPYAAGQLVVDGRPTDGDLAFRVVTTDGSVSDHVVEVVRGAGARLLDQPWFALVWLVLLGGAGVLVALGRRRQVSKR